MTARKSQDIYDGNDPRLLPAYPLAEAAWLAGVPNATLRAWMKPGSVTKSGQIEPTTPVIVRPESDTQYLSFVNVIEAHILSAIRNRYKIPLSRVRSAVAFMRRHLGSVHPLAEKRFKTDGLDLFYEELGLVVNASRGGLLAFPELIEAHLERIEYDDSNLPVRLFPFVGRCEESTLPSQSRVVVVDPRIAFGRPNIANSGIATRVVASRFKAGEDIASIAYDYNRAEEEIIQALQFERIEVDAA